MTYYRPSPVRFLWGVVIALALAVALFFGTRATVAAIRADERAAVLREGDAMLAKALDHAAVLRRERDSLAAVVRQVDTVLVERIRRVRDTAWLPADTNPRVRLAACRAALDTLAADCDTFRRVATTALAKADTIRRGDSTALAGLSWQLAAVRRADSAKAARLEGMTRQRRTERAICAGSLAFNVLQWKSR